MSESIARVAILEQRSTQLARDLARALDRIARLEAMLTQLGGTSSGSGGSGAGFYIDAVVISAGGNVTNQTVKYRVGGTVTTLTTTATVYNEMAAATVSTSGKTIMVNPYGDGSFVAVSQSC